MTEPNYSELQMLARQMRLAVLAMNHAAGSGHTGGSFSCAEILAVLYEQVLRVDPRCPDDPGRDRFVLSKGHAAPALYATLARKGFFPAELLATLRQTGSPLQGHPCMFKVPGVDMSTGSLGMGLSVGVGMALAARTQGANWRTFVLCGDGELDEGQNWEAMMAAAKWQLGSLTLIVDRNGVQLDGTVEEVMPLGDLAAKIAAFGFRIHRCDGHDCRALHMAFQAALAGDGPAAIVADTVKGKGVSFMEGKAEWHGKPINAADYARALAELGGEVAS